MGAGLNATGEFLTVRYSQLNYSLAVHLPWEDFDPIGEVALADFNGSLTRFSDEGIDSNHTQMWFTTLQQDDEGTVVIDEHSFTFDIPATGLCTSSLQISVEAVTAIGTLTTLLQVRTLPACAQLSYMHPTPVSIFALLRENTVVVFFHAWL